MHPSDNVAAVKSLFAAYQQGDIQTVLSGLTEDVTWEFPGPPNIPIAGRCLGRDQVAGFFKRLSGAADMRLFQPRQFIAEGDNLVVLGSSTFVVRANGREISNDWVMVFTMRGGKVARFREFTDTAVLSRAFGGEHTMLEGVSGTP